MSIVAEINPELLDLQRDAAEVEMEIVQDGVFEDDSPLYRIQHRLGVTSIPMTASQVRSLIAYRRSHR